jgi:excisionase family DNA binding protein
MNEHKPEYVSVRVVCERYGWHKSTVHRLLSRKRITGKKDGRKTMVYLPSVEAYVQSLPDR